MVAAAVLLPARGAGAEPAAKPLKVVMLGDSLTAGYGLPAPQAFPVKLQQALQQDGIAADLINAGVSGDTASGGTKPATTETGLVVQVPLFLNTGDRIKVDTRTGSYLERA